MIWHFNQIELTHYLNIPWRLGVVEAKQLFPPWHPAWPGAPTTTIGCVFGWEAGVDQVIMFFLLHQGCYSHEYFIILYLDVNF